MKSNLKDQDWLENLPIYNEFCEKGGHFIHGSISRDCALKLGAYPMIEAVMKDIEVDDFLDGTPYGQHEDLVDRLNGILKKYPADTSIFREFIQNADDAKATEIAFVLDDRKYPDCRLLSNDDNWKRLQRTPALCIFNNRPFTEEDIIGISQLGRGGKGDTADTIGRFGIGFNVAYHVTDCPCFVSFDAQCNPRDFCVFDPLKRYCPRSARNKTSGRRWKNKGASLEQFPDQFEPFLVKMFDEMRSMVPSSFGDLSQGFTMFRLPITHWNPQPYYYNSSTTSTKQRYLKEGRAGNFLTLRSLTSDLKIESDNMLLFLNSLKHISVFELKKGSCMHHFTTTSGSVAAKPSTTCSPSYEMTLCHQISSKDPDETRWLINKRRGLPTSVSSISKHAKERGLEPFGGTAVQVHNNIQGSLFCFLPMSIPSCLPVHFNAHFLVDDSRKHLDNLPHLEDWNNVISEHILVPSYLELILETRSYVSADNEESIKWYYNLFPDLQSLSSKSEASKLNMEKKFYVQLLKNDHPVLLDARAIAKGEVEWLTPKGSMFCVDFRDVQIMNSKLQTILVSLGMPIVHAPTSIFDSFCRIEDSDYRGFVTPDNVLHHIAGLDEEDADVSDIIKDNCELLIQFCIQIKTNAQIKEALKGVPLLLTKEGTLNRSGLLYSCKYSALLPHCSEKFIVELLENSKVVGKKLQDAGVIVDLPIHIVAQYIQFPDITKPVGLSADQIHLLKLFWRYISSQGFQGLFLSCSCITEYYNTKPIIPAADGLFYPPRLSKCVLNESDDSNKSVISVMKMLGYSTDSFIATIGHKPSISSLLLHVSSASDVIKCLQLHPPTIDKSELKFTPEEASHFISLLSLCDEIPAPVAELLKSLPLFQTVDSTFITLSEGKRFYIKPMAVPSEGIINIQRETKELVLEHPGIQADQFYKKIISKQAYLSAQPGSAKFYIQYIIPNFIFLSDKD